MFSSVRVAFIVVALFFLGSAVMCKAEARPENPLNGVIDVVGYYNSPEYPCFRSQDLARIMNDPLKEWILLMGVTEINSVYINGQEYQKGIIYVMTNPKLKKFSVLLELPDPRFKTITCMMEFGFTHPEMEQTYSSEENKDEGF